MLNIRKRMGQEGLTLIELLITIAVIAVVAAISIPVITNVISSSETNAAASMDAQVDSFIDKYSQSGEVTFDGTDTFTAWVDLNGDGTFDDPAEVIETFAVDTTQFTVTVDSNTAPTSAGTSVAAATGSAAAPATTTFTLAGGDWTSVYAYYEEVAFTDASPALQTAISNLQVGDVITFSYGGSDVDYTWTAADVAGVGAVSYQASNWGLAMSWPGLNGMPTSLDSITFN